MCDRKTPLKLKSKIYRTVVRPVALYGAEFWPTTLKHEQTLHTVEMRMLPWTHRITRLGRVRKEDVRSMFGVAPIAAKMQEARLSWYGHVLRNEDSSVAKTAMNTTVGKDVDREGDPKPDLFELNEGSTTEYLSNLWKQHWEPRMKEYLRRKEHRSKLSGKDRKQKEPTPPSVVGCLLGMFRWEFLSATALKLTSDILQFANPFFLHQLIGFVSSPNSPLWKGLSYAILMFAVSETLRLSCSARREKTIGEIVNLMAIDVDRFQRITAQIQQFWSCPFQILMGLTYLFITLGYSAAPGVVIMIVFLPTNILGSISVKKWQVRQMKLKDERIKMIHEVLNGIKAIVSNNRLKNYFVADELDPGVVERDHKNDASCLMIAAAKDAIEFENFSAAWDSSDSNSTTLQDINLSAARGALIAVVGKVGCGKSSLLSALLGEMGKLHGRIGVRGKVAYVPQLPWIQNMTVRDNILFGKPFDKRRYNQVLNACALKPDLKILPSGDMTEIGEK
ncbi:hypothetical protein ANCCEY_14458, partial [Ancylostoma ceylanicum]